MNSYYLQQRYFAFPNDISSVLILSSRGPESFRYLFLLRNLQLLLLNDLLLKKAPSEESLTLFRESQQKLGIRDLLICVYSVVCLIDWFHSINFQDLRMKRPPVLTLYHLWSSSIFIPFTRLYFECVMLLTVCEILRIVESTDFQANCLLKKSQWLKPNRSLLC
jgi:hypothetical protein